VEERRRSTVTTSAFMVYHRRHGRSRACDCEHARELRTETGVREAVR
jgi:hypothetical protein